MTISKSGGGYRVGGALGEASLRQMNAAVAYTTTGPTLNASDLTGGLVTCNNGSAQTVTLPLATDLDTALPNAQVNDAFEFSVIELGAGTATVTTNTGWTLSGYMAVATDVSGRFLARKTGVGAWTLYRLA